MTDREAPAGVADLLREVASLRRQLDVFRLAAQRDRGLVGAILNQTTHGVIICDVEGHLTLNGAAERIWTAGPAVAGVSEWSRYRAFHPDGRPFAPEDWSMARALRTGETTDPEYIRIQRFDGSRADLLAGAAPIRNSEGEITGAIGVFADVTALKEREADLLRLERSAARRSAFLSEASAILASSLDYESTLASVARLAVPEIADWCAVDLADDFWQGVPAAIVAHADPTKVEMARELQRRFPPDRAAPRGVPEVLRTGHPELYSEITDEMLAVAARSPDELAVLRELQLRSAMVVPMSARGRILGAITLFSTTPDRRYGPDDLEMAAHLARRAGLAVDNARLYRQAQDAIRARDELLAFVSHDLKNPLGAVLMSATLLERSVADPKAARHAATIRRSAQRMDRLIRDLLDVSTMEAGRFKVEKRSDDGPAILLESAALLQPLALEKGARLEVVADPSTPPVLADREAILRVLSNLVGNAIGFTPAGGVVTLRCRADAEGARFSVSDDGPGIPLEDHPHVFERFWKSRDSKGGTGLGLAIARGIVEAHGGRIWFESRRGAGTTFHFTCPPAA